MKNVRKKPSVLPVYLVAVVWLIGGIVFKVHRPFGFVLLALISIAIIGFGFQLFPKRVELKPGSRKHRSPAKKTSAATGAEDGIAEPAERTAPQREPEPVRAVPDPEIDQLKTNSDRALGEIRRLSRRINNVAISVEVEHIYKETTKIFEHLSRFPDKKRQVRRFLKYYLPTLVKLLQSYEKIESSGIKDPRSDAAKAKIVEMVRTISRAFNHQNAALEANEILDLTAEIQTLEQLLGVN